ncbi:hypothetical protein ACFFRS_23365, partial [Saccharopolyspora hordei]
MHTVTGLVGFARALRHSGMACGPTRVQAFLAAVEEVGLDRDALYWAGRLTLCSDPDDVPRYDAAFTAWFGGDGVSAEPVGRPQPRPSQIAALAPADAGAGAEGEDRPLAAAA